MKGEDWGVLVGIIVALGSFIGPWMWSVNSKLARIAETGRAVRWLARSVVRHELKLEEHDRLLDEHGETIKTLKTNVASGP